MKEIISTWSFLTRGQKSVFVALIVGQFLANGIDLVGLAAIGLLIMALASGEIDIDLAGLYSIRVEETPPEFIVGLIGLAAGAFFMKAIASLMLSLSQIRYAAWIEVAASREMAHYLLHGSLTSIRRYSPAEAQFVLSGATSAMFSGTLNSVSSIITGASVAVTILGAFVLVNPIAALALSLYLVGMVTSIQFLISRRLVQIGKKVRKYSIQSGSTVLDAVNSFKEIAVLGKQGLYLDRFARAKILLARTSSTTTVLRIVPRILIEQGLLIGVLLFVGWQVFAGGDVVAGLATVGVFVVGSLRIIGAVMPIQNAISNLKTIGAKAEMARELYEEVRRQEKIGTASADAQGEAASLQANGISRNSTDGMAVEMVDVSFSYPSSKEPAIKNISLSVPAGSFVALVGPSGAGKTTLADVMLGLNIPSSGSITVDGRDPSWWRQAAPGAISYVPQRPGMVSGTVAQNVALGIADKKIDEGWVWECLKFANLGETVSALPGGIHANLGKQTDQLSGGQLQRLGLARALYPRPRLVILDEATSALDAGSEATISNNIRGLGGSVTLVVIAHRLSTIQHADCVYVVDEGKIIASGPFNTLRKTVPMIEEYVRLMSFDDIEE